MLSRTRANPLREVAICLEATIALKERSYLVLVEEMTVQNRLDWMVASWDALSPAYQLVRHSASSCKSCHGARGGSSEEPGVSKPYIRRPEDMDRGGEWWGVMCSVY